MEHAGIWISVFIVLFVLGSVMGLKVSPREKALGLMRDKARKIGLHPRIVPAPAWTKIPKATEERARMVAYYSMLIPEAQFPLLQATVENGQLNVVQGAQKFNGTTLALKGIYAIDMQSNSVGLYWDEESDLRATQLDAIKNFLLAMAAQSSR